MLEAEYIRNLELKEIASLPNLIIGFKSSGQGKNIGLVYSLDNLRTSDFDPYSKVVIAANPAEHL